MPEKNKESIESNVEKYKEYFKDDLDAIEIELSKSKEYSKIIDDEINKLTGPSLGMNKGGQHYLIEHITNAVQLQTQRQGLRRDRFAIKKAILDYASKFADNEEAEASTQENYLKEIAKLIAEQKEQLPTKAENSDEDLDAEIEKMLEAK